MEARSNPVETTPAERVAEARVAIDRVYGDTRVTQQTTLENLEDIAEHLQTCISAVEQDIELAIADEIEEEEEEEDLVDLEDDDDEEGDNKLDSNPFDDPEDGNR